MDFKSPPARITTAMHTGAVAAGNALSMTATLTPLDPAPVKDVRLFKWADAQPAGSLSSSGAGH
jgi:hypothetical protein